MFLEYYFFIFLLYFLSINMLKSIFIFVVFAKQVSLFRKKGYNHKSTHTIVKFFEHHDVLGIRYLF